MTDKLAFGLTRNEYERVTDCLPKGATLVDVKVITEKRTCSHSFKDANYIQFDYKAGDKIYRSKILSKIS
jgi:hypothetical protein